MTGERKVIHCPGTIRISVKRTCEEKRKNTKSLRGGRSDARTSAQKKSAAVEIEKKVHEAINDECSLKATEK